MRIFELKAFHRFARRERIASAALREAVERIDRGLIDADLGGGLIKQRVARPGAGRSGGYRVLLAYRRKARTVFLYGFAKSDRDNIEEAEMETFRLLGKRLIESALDRLVPGAPFIQFSYGFKPPVLGTLKSPVQLGAFVWRNLPPARVWVYRRA